MNTLMVTPTGETQSMAWTSLILGQGAPLLKVLIEGAFITIVLLVYRKPLTNLLYVLTAKIGHAQSLKTPLIEITGPPEPVEHLRAAQRERTFLTEKLLQFPRSNQPFTLKQEDPHSEDN